MTFTIPTFAGVDAQSADFTLSLAHINLRRADNISQTTRQHPKQQCGEIACVRVQRMHQQLRLSLAVVSFDLEQITFILFAKKAMITVPAPVRRLRLL